MKAKGGATAFNCSGVIAPNVKVSTRCSAISGAHSHSCRCSQASKLAGAATQDNKEQEVHTSTNHTQDGMLNICLDRANCCIISNESGGYATLVAYNKQI